MNIRTDVFSDPDLAKDWKDWKDKADLGEWGAPKTWQQVQAVTKFLKGKKVKGKEVYGFLDQPKPWGGFCFYFTVQPRDGLREISGREELAVRREHEAAGQQSRLGARDPGRRRRAAL